MEENKEKIEETKQKSSAMTIVIVILLMIGCLVGGYFISESGVFNKKEPKNAENEKNKEEEKEVEKEEELDVKSEHVTKLFENITNANRHYCGYYGLFTNKKMTANDISVYERFSILIRLIYKDYGDTEGKTYTKAEVEKVYRQIFGKDVPIEYDAANSVKSCPSFSYDSTKEIYTVGGHACGGACGPNSNRSQVVKASKKGDTIILDVKVLFADENGHYSDYDKTNKIDITDYSDEAASKVIIEKGTLYKVVFKLEDGSYVFVSTEPVK